MEALHSFAQTHTCNAIVVEAPELLSAHQLWMHQGSALPCASDRSPVRATASVPTQHAAVASARHFYVRLDREDPSAFATRVLRQVASLRGLTRITYIAGDPSTPRHARMSLLEGLSARLPEGTTLQIVAEPQMQSTLLPLLGALMDKSSRVHLRILFDDRCPRLPTSTSALDDGLTQRGGWKPNSKALHSVHAL